VNNFQRITASRETLAAFLGTIPAIETPWGDAFHRIYCSSCSAADCDDCRRPERDSPLKSFSALTNQLVALLPEKEKKSAGDELMSFITKPAARSGK